MAVLPRFGVPAGAAVLWDEEGLPVDGGDRRAKARRRPTPAPHRGRPSRARPHSASAPSPARRTTPTTTSLNGSQCILPFSFLFFYFISNKQTKTNNLQSFLIPWVRDSITSYSRIAVLFVVKGMGSEEETKIPINNTIVMKTNKRENKKDVHCFLMVTTRRSKKKGKKR